MSLSFMTLLLNWSVPSEMCFAAIFWEEQWLLTSFLIERSRLWFTLCVYIITRILKILSQIWVIITILDNGAEWTNRIVVGGAELGKCVSKVTGLLNITNSKNFNLGSEVWSFSFSSSPPSSFNFSSFSPCFVALW